MKPQKSRVVFRWRNWVLSVVQCNRSCGLQVALIVIVIVIVRRVRNLQPATHIGFPKVRAHGASSAPGAEKIWGLIQQLVSAIADFFSADFDEILTNIIYENKQLNAIMRVAQQLQPAA